MQISTKMDDLGVPLFSETAIYWRMTRGNVSIWIIPLATPTWPLSFFCDGSHVLKIAGSQHWWSRNFLPPGCWNTFTFTHAGSTLPETNIALHGTCKLCGWKTILSFWDGFLAGAMLISGSVVISSVSCFFLQGILIPNSIPNNYSSVVRRIENRSHVRGGCAACCCFPEISATIFVQEKIFDLYQWSEAQRSQESEPTWFVTIQQTVFRKYPRCFNWAMKKGALVV